MRSDRAVCEDWSGVRPFRGRRREAPARARPRTGASCRRAPRSAPLRRRPARVLAPCRRSDTTQARPVGFADAWGRYRSFPREPVAAALLRPWSDIFPDRLRTSPRNPSNKNSRCVPRAVPDAASYAGRRSCRKRGLARRPARPVIDCRIPSDAIHVHVDHARIVLACGRSENAHGCLASLIDRSMLPRRSMNVGVRSGERRSWRLSTRNLDTNTPYGYIVAMRKDIKASCARRLQRIEGQVRGIARMVEEDRYCIDIVTQVSAVRAALRRLEEEILQEHVAHCVEHAIASGNKADQRKKIEELMAVVRRADR